MVINFDTSVYQQMLDNFKKAVIYTPVTKTIDNITGSETLTDGTTSSINITFYRQEDTIEQKYLGLFRGADAIALIDTSITININDKITYDSETYRVEKQPTTRRLGTTAFYIVVRLFKV